MALELTPSQRRQLKKQAHHLKVIVATGSAGLTTAVLAEMDRALTDHELVKVKLTADGRDARQAMMTTACEQLDAACIQTIGHIATLYRPNPDQQDTASQRAPKAQ